MPPTPWFSRSSSSEATVGVGNSRNASLKFATTQDARRGSVEYLCPHTSTLDILQLLFQRTPEKENSSVQYALMTSLCLIRSCPMITLTSGPQSTSVGTAIGGESWVHKPLIGSFCPMCSVYEVRYSEQRIGQLQSCSCPRRLREG